MDDRRSLPWPTRPDPTRRADMPPVTILSPYSGRPVKVREQDLGRALRDEQGRVFYIVEDPEHGRYAARTRKGSPKDLERYREIGLEFPS